MEYYVATKKKEILLFAKAWMGLENIMLSERKPVRERQIPCDFNYMWNLINKISKHNRNRLIDTENRLIGVRVDGV